MTTSIRLFVCLGLLSLLFPSTVAAKAPSGPIQLFDGKTFHGWIAKGGGPVTKNWSIEDGMLALNGVGGSLVTVDEYGDFDLSFEWRLADHGNSGVKYRVNYYEKGVYGHPGWLGCEYQLFNDPKRTATTKYSTGALYDLYPPTADQKLRPAGEFNDSRIVAHGTKIEHWLNGVKVVSADMSSDEWKERIAASKFNDVKGFMQKPKGRIELQDHSSRVWFRNLALTPLDSSE